MKRTNKIRLTESQLHNVIKESVKRILREGEFDNMYDYIDSLHLNQNVPHKTGFFKGNGEDYHAWG